jgi:hypothetical protein
MLGLPGEELSQELRFWLYSDNKWFQIWSAKQNTGDKWRLVRLNLNGNGTHHIGFQGLKKGKPLNNMSDIAIDDLKTYNGKCPEFSKFD